MIIKMFSFVFFMSIKSENRKIRLMSNFYALRVNPHRIKKIRASVS